jgi:hypothetical protein
VVTDRLDIGELFNPFADAGAWEIKTDPFTGTTYIQIEHDPKYIVETNKRVLQVQENIDLLTKVTDTGHTGVFGVTLEYYLDIIEEVAPLLLQSDNIQFIKLERADVLFSILSLNIATNTGNFHNTVVPNTRTHSRTAPEPINISIERFTNVLDRYIRRQQVITEYVGDVPTIYYEQFQSNVSNLRNMFNGIPHRIISSPYLKVGLNYKSFIKNLLEVEDCYEQFVNEHKEYFPQYFGKLPHVQIPACQGKQPIALSELYDQLRAETC